MNIKNLEKENQKNFEKQLELLILFKKLNPNKVVYLNKTSIKEASEWYISKFNL